MGKIEGFFNEWIQAKYRHHDELQNKEDERIKRKENDLASLDSTAEAFEEKMEFTSVEIEKWLIKNQLDK
ncbi:hypothetical protein [Metabacillus litoralis]|uniref:hypothetical protein n=1 Tax=Metabacillus litoralis TaxID=152268 RepID=UPI001CFCDF27|nr:hypothetical protein [Metabacillus litoralis]